MAAPGTLRVLIADDYPIMRGGLAARIRHCADFELVGEAANGKEAITLSAQTRPDVILMDLLMPVLDGVTATRNIRRKRPRTQVIALTNFLSPDLLMRALDAGAIAYLLKTIDGDALETAIRRAARREATFAPEVEQLLVPSVQHRHLAALTGREREVLDLMTRGMNNAQIAEYLTISLWTVKKHVSNIFDKTRATNRAQLIAYALEQRIISERSMYS